MPIVRYLDDDASLPFYKALGLNRTGFQGGLFA